MPRPQVIRFQTIAPISAAKITCASITLGSMIPVPMVWATLSPNTPKATKLKNAAHSTAYCGRSTRVETMVAIELAASCSPLRKSNSSATAINPDQDRKTKRGIHGAALPYTCSMTMLLISLATSSKRSATFSRWS